MSKEVDEINYKTDQGTSNEVILGKRRSNTSDESKKKTTTNKKTKVNGGSERRLAKKKRRNLLQIVERKKNRQSRESLLSSLLEHQLQPAVRQQLLSTQRMQNKTNQRNNVDDSNRKMSSIAGAARSTTVICPQVQENYYETDSSSSEDETKSNEIAVDIKIEADDDDDVQILESEKKSMQQVIKVESDKPVQQVEKVPAVNVPVVRRADVIATRCKLPIFAEEQAIVEAIRENTVTVLCGETGSGKTTQVPQFLYEAGYAQNDRIIGITEPRRVAAITMANRVGYELNRSDIVSYQIRYEGDRNPNTRILFMTDGVLLRELQHDVMLSRYSAIIIDEAHERSMYSDVLIGLLSRIAPMRAKKNDPLKLIIMSATLRLSDFTQSRLFPIAPRVLSVESRQFPVTIHFSRRTPENYLHETYRKVCRVHSRMPAGAILVFVTGQQDIRTLLRWLRKAYPRVLDNATTSLGKVPPPDLDQPSNDDNVDEEESTSTTINTSPLYCLPLYSLLAPDQQARVFAPSPSDCRLCIIATNVAETSITIPGVRYVIDCGKEKSREYDPITGVTRFSVRWICKASAAQRAGRAGRTAPGHAYRLYSSALFNDEMVEFGAPEILAKPVDQLVLQLKSMNIVRVRNFPFPTAPDADAIDAAERRLVRMGALELSTKKEARITTLGRTLALFPLAPGFGKILAIADQHSLLPYAVCLVAALSVREPIYALTDVRGDTDDSVRQKMMVLMQQRREWSNTGYQSRQLGDLCVLIKAVCAVEKDGGGANVCDRYGVHYKAMIEVRKLRRQLTNIINRTCTQLSQPLVLDAHMQPMSALQEKLLRQTVLAGLAEQVARRVDRLATDEPIPKGAYQTQQMKEFVFIHPSSVLYSEQPDYVVYQEIVQFSDKKTMLTVFAIDVDWLASLTPEYCQFASSSDTVEARYDRKQDRMTIAVSASFGIAAWPLGIVDRPHPININVYRWFAVALLKGDVCSQLALYADRLLAAPTTMIKSWARLQPRTEHLLDALVEYSVASGGAFAAQCSTNRNYLLDEYCEWLPESVHDEVRSWWPPVFAIE